MATLNGQILNIKGINIKSAHNNIYTTLPGTASNSVYDLGYEGLLLTITGWEVTMGAYQLVLNQLMKTGQQSLIIIDGWEYRVYVMSVDRNIDSHANYYPWSAKLQTEDPYQYSTDDTTRDKTITSDGQQWSADNSTYPILNSQVADTTADVEVTGVANATYTSHIRYEDDMDIDVNVMLHSTGYVLMSTQVFPAESYHSVVLHDVSAAIQGDEGLTSGMVKVTYQVEGESEHDYCELSNGSSDYETKTYAGDIIAGLGHSITVRWYGTASATGTFGRSTDLYARVSMRRRQTTTSPEIFNTSNTSLKGIPCNRLPHNAVARINTDGTGTYDYVVGFDSFNALYDCYLSTGVTISSSQAAFGNDSYIKFDIDTKYPIVGIPTLHINYTGSGSYAYIDDYAIDSFSPGASNNLDNPSYHLAGRTSFTLMIYCSTSVSFAIQDFTLHIDTNAGSAAFPVVLGDSVTNTFQCNQADGASDAALIGLSYYERRWG